MAYKLYSDTITSFGQSYSGPAQVAEITFNTGPEQLSFLDDWMRNHIVSDATNAVEKNGGQLIRVQLYRDQSPTWTTKWRLLLTAKPPAEMSSCARMGIAPVVFWGLVLGAILLVSWITRKALGEIKDIIWGPGDGSNPPLGIPWIGWIGIGLIVVWAMGKRKRGEI